MWQLALVLSITWIMIACGTETETKTVDCPTATVDNSWNVVKPIVMASCVTCHDGVKQNPKLDSGAALKASNAKARLTAGTMPPAGHEISAVDKAALLAYLGG